MLVKLISKTVAKHLCGAVGDMIFPGVGGVIGRTIGNAIGGAYGDIASDPQNWADGLAIKNELFDTLGYDPFDFL